MKCLYRLLMISNVFVSLPCANAEQYVNVVDFLSWGKVRLDTDAAEYVNVELDGFIQFEGGSDYPVVRLWESRDAMKFGRPFMRVYISSESISPLLWATAKSPSLVWKSLNGKYVAIRGVFKDQERGLDYITLGAFTKVFEVTVTMENGEKVSYRDENK